MTEYLFHYHNKEFRMLLFNGKLFILVFLGEILPFPDRTTDEDKLGGSAKNLGQIKRSLKDFSLH